MKQSHILVGLILSFVVEIFVLLFLAAQGPTYKDPKLETLYRTYNLCKKYNVYEYNSNFTPELKQACNDAFVQYGSYPVIRP